MSVITMRDAKRDFSLGYLTRFAIGRSIQNLGEWNILLGHYEKSAFLSDARTKQTRTFKSLDTAVKALEEIGVEVDVLEQR